VPTVFHIREFSRALGIVLLTILIAATPVGWTSVALAADGYAGTNGGTTGGAGGATVTVTNAADFIQYVDDADQTPYIVQVSGNIDLGSENVRVRGNKTIVGLPGSHLTGNLKCFRAEESNNIFQNLDMDNVARAGDKDCISLDGVQHIWIDHCTFTDGGDGNVDVKNGADWITVSWSIFKYTFDSGHNFSNLIGHDDDNGSVDRGKLHVTFHHCWWGNLTRERMPRVRFGRIHSYNNYFNCTGNNYCVRVCLESETLLENSYFDSVDEPWQYLTLSGQTPGKIRSVNNTFVNCTGIVPDDDAVFTPSYSYTPNAAADVPALVTTYAGAWNPTPPPPLPAWSSVSQSVWLQY
jgi:pectate lyase